jgi:transposase
VLDHHVRAPDFLAFVLELRRMTQRPIILVCDRLNVHRSAVRQLEEQGTGWLTVEWLRPYAPDLNPVEAIWNHAKYADLPNRVPADAFELCDLVAESLNDQHFRAPLLGSYFRRAGLTLKDSSQSKGQ